jgi:cytoskeletal protein RodZ
MHELAEYLKTERLKQGLSVDFVSEKTRISVSMIEALEAGELDRIGITLIIRSFIRTYCDVLGLESTPLIEKYEQHIGAFDRQGKGMRKYGEWCRSIRRQSHSKTLLIILLVLLAVGTLIGGAWFSVWLKQQQSVEKTSGVYPSQELPSDLISQQGGALASVEGMEGSAVPSRHSEALAGSQGPPAIPGKAVTDKPSASEVLPADAEESSSGAGRLHVLSLEAVRKARVKLRIDDQTVVAFTLKAGERKELEVARVVDIELRDGKSLRVKWDGENVMNSERRVRLPLPEREEGRNP